MKEKQKGPSFWGKIFGTKGDCCCVEIEEIEAPLGNGLQKADTQGKASKKIEGDKDFHDTRRG